MYFTDSKLGNKELRQWRPRKLLIGISLFPFLFGILLISDIYDQYPRIISLSTYITTVFFLLSGLILIGIRKSVEFRKATIVSKWYLFFFLFKENLIDNSDFKEILVEEKHTPGGEGSNGRKHYNVLISHKREKIKDYDISLHVFLSAKNEIEEYKDFINKLSYLTNLPISYLSED